jgi:RND family efflux transporter MFP subunit
LTKSYIYGNFSGLIYINYYNYMNKKAIKFMSLSLLIFVGLALSGCGKQDDVEDKAEIKKKVNIQEIVEQTEVNSELVLSGAVVPQEYSMIRSLTPGTIEFLAPVGSEVYAGQPLFSIRDEGVESNYRNSLQSFQQTQITTSQRTQQVELALNSTKARLDLARVQYNNSVAQTEQATNNIEDSAMVAYSSAYNTLNQFLLFLNQGVNLDNPKYIYENILTAQSQFSTDVRWQFIKTVNTYKTLSFQPSLEDLDNDLSKIHQALLDSKISADNTIVLLQNAIPGTNFTPTNIENDKLIITTHQSSINQHLTNIITTINSKKNIKISNNIAINNAQSQLDLAEIEYSNSEIALQNAKDGAALEQSMSQSQLDGAAYNYNNLTLPSPFSGTILSHSVSAGEQVSMGQELIEIGNLSIIEITVEVDVDFAKAIKLGDEVLIDENYKGFVTQVDPIGDLQSGKVSVRVQSQDADQGLVAGSTAEVAFSLVYTDIDTIVVPIKSVTIESSGNYVFVVNQENKVLRKNVNLGQVYGDKVSVVSGLEEGDRLILLNGVFVSIDDEVEIIQQ